MTDVLLIICEALLAVIVLYTGFYLLTHRNRKFLLFDPTSEPSLKIMKELPARISCLKMIKFV